MVFCYELGEGECFELFGLWFIFDELVVLFVFNELIGCSGLGVLVGVLVLFKVCIEGLLFD